jgi:hypothetical protein
MPDSVWFAVLAIGAGLFFWWVETADAKQKRS